MYRLVLARMTLIEIRQPLYPLSTRYFSNVLQLFFTLFFIFLFFIQTLDEMIAWSIDDHVMGTSRSLSPRKRAYPNRIGTTNQLAINS